MPRIRAEDLRGAFVVICKQLDGGEAELAALTARIAAGIAACAVPAGVPRVTASIGMTVATDHGGPERVIARAHAAMHTTKTRAAVARR